MDESQQFQPDPASDNEAGKQSVQLGKYAFPLQLLFAFLLGIVSLLVYANSLTNGFVLDDPGVITRNTIVTKGVSAIPELLTTPYRKGAPLNSTSNDLYRPLSLITFAVEYQFFGSSPFPFHLVNVVLFASCVMLLFFFLDRLFDKKKTVVVFVAALLFAIHPLHTEVVANIKSRDVLLCFFFAFTGLLLFHKYMRIGKVGLLVAASFSFFLSLLSQEAVITFIAVIPLIFFFYDNDNRKRAVLIAAGVTAAAVVYLVTRFAVLNAHHAGQMADIAFIDNPLVGRDISLESRMATAILSLGYYLRLLFFPYPLICDYSYNSIPLTHFTDIRVLGSLLIYLLLAAVGIIRFRKDRKDAFAFGIFYFLLTISLFSNIPFLIRSTLAERFTFFPSVGFCLCIALLIGRTAGRNAATGLKFFKNEKVLLILATLVIFYTAVTVDRNGEWKSNETLFKSDIKKAPNSCHLNFLTGVEYEGVIAENEYEPPKKKQDIEDGLVYLRRSIAIYPDYWASQLEIAHAFIKINLFDSVEPHAIRTIQLDPSNIDAINMLGGIYCIKRKYFQAISVYRMAIDLNPGYVLPYANIGLCNGYMGVYDSAVYYSRKAISIDPSYTAPYEYLATIYKITGNADSSSKYEAVARRSNPAFRAKSQFN